MRFDHLVSPKSTFGLISLYAHFLFVLQMPGLVSSAKCERFMHRTTSFKQRLNIALPGLFLPQAPYEEDYIVDLRFQRTISHGKYLKWLALIY